MIIKRDSPQTYCEGCSEEAEYGSHIVTEGETIIKEDNYTFEDGFYCTSCDYSSNNNDHFYEGNYECGNCGNVFSEMSDAIGCCVPGVNGAGMCYGKSGGDCLCRHYIKHLVDEEEVTFTVHSNELRFTTDDIDFSFCLLCHCTMEEEDYESHYCSKQISSKEQTLLGFKNFIEKDPDDWITGYTFPDDDEESEYQEESSSLDGCEICNSLGYTCSVHSRN